MGGRSGSMCTFTERRRRAVCSAAGTTWVSEQRRVSWDTREVAVVVCDMWDRHWSAGATRRVEQMVPALNQFLGTLRDQGALIVFAPAGTMAYYDARPEFALVRRRASSFPAVRPHVVIDLPRWPLPFDIANGG
ncbi:MAG: hypothetical protein OWT27_07290, partial [Firmicutes bacterium]|nr:hypothetical protein [Bacillota bacterium]